MSQATRAWIYRGMVVAGVGLLVVGWVTEEQVVTALGLVGSVLGNVTSSVYTPFREVQ